jgi:hypothetical protein
LCARASRLGDAHASDCTKRHSLFRANSVNARRHNKNKCRPSTPGHHCCYTELDRTTLPFTSFRSGSGLGGTLCRRSEPGISTERSGLTLCRVLGLNRTALPFHALARRSQARRFVPQTGLACVAKPCRLYGASPCRIALFGMFVFVTSGCASLRRASD